MKAIKKLELWLAAMGSLMVAMKVDDWVAMRADLLEKTVAVMAALLAVMKVFWKAVQLDGKMAMMLADEMVLMMVA